MHARRLTACLGVFAVGLGVLTFVQAAPVERERNGWPMQVAQFDDAGRPSQWSAVGPLAFGKMDAEGVTTKGVRPFWVQQNDAEGRFRAGYFLYPLFTYQSDQTTYQWSILQLIRRTDRHAAAGAPQSTLETRGDFEVWPFWFSRQTGEPDLNYRGLFPIAGTVKNKLGMDQAKWVLFPFYIETEKKGTITRFTPWPIVRMTKGAAHGFGIWPLCETRERPGRWRTETYLWPLGYNNTTYPAPDAPTGTPPGRQIGVLPFYARHSGPGLMDESYLWPFFGYTDRTQPTRYHETRYFWPFLVQGRGDNRYVNRWGPFYTHSVVKGYDKTWYAWPLVRRASWEERGLAVQKTQLLFFLYWSEQQKDLGKPRQPTATLTHVWPLYSTWNNGAGREQLQVFSPFEVFFPGNEKVRAAWSPLVAVARHEQSAPGETKTSLLWNAVSWRRSEARHEREFHLGPLFSVSSQNEERRVAVGNGLISFRRDASGRWKTLWLDFHPNRVTASDQPR